MKSSLQGPSKIFAIAICAIAWLSLGLQLYILLDNAEANGLTLLEATSRYLGYFTILTNLLVAVALTAILAGSGLLYRFFSRFTVQSAIALYICIVGITYNLILRNLWRPQGLQRIADEGLHVVVPLLYLLFWLFVLHKRRIPWKDLLYWLIYPLAYLVFAMARATVDGFYPYPFLNVSVIGYSVVLVYIAAITGAFIVGGSILILIAGSSARNDNKVASAN